MNQLTKEFLEKHIDKIIKEFNFLNRQKNHPNECPCYAGKICHNIEPEKLNCFLCYCPEYKNEIKEGGCKINNPNGKWLETSSGKIWDCSDCNYPHNKEVVRKHLKKLFGIN